MIVLPSAAVALAETRIYSSADGGGFPVEPRKLEYRAGDSEARQSFRFKKLDWRNWGARRARSHARLYSCLDPGPCFTAGAELTAKRRRRRGGISYYTRLRAVFGQDRVVIRLGLPGR
jgi:hypothetical protein